MINTRKRKMSLGRYSSKSAQRRKKRDFIMEAPCSQMDSILARELRVQMVICTLDQVRWRVNKLSARQMTPTSTCKSLRESSVNISLFLSHLTAAKSNSSLTLSPWWWSLVSIVLLLLTEHSFSHWLEPANSTQITCLKYSLKLRRQLLNLIMNASTASIPSMLSRSPPNCFKSIKQLSLNRVRPILNRHWSNNSKFRLTVV